MNVTLRISLASDKIFSQTDHCIRCSSIFKIECCHAELIFNRTQVSLLSTLVSDLTIVYYWCCWDLSDMTLADEDSYTMLVFGLIKAILVSSNKSWVCSWFWSWILVNTLKLKFGQEFEAEVWSRFWSWTLVNLWCDLKAITLVRAQT